MLKEAWLESRGRIPGNRGELYANFITRMLRLDDNKMLNTAISRERRLEALESLAAAMQEAGTLAWTRRQVLEVIPEESSLDALLVNGLLQGEDVLRFAPHQTFQEHFAARAIRAGVEQELAQRKLPAWRRLFARPETGVLARAGDAWWAETLFSWPE